MLINAVTYTFPRDRVADAEALLRELAVASRTEPGCLSYDAARSIDDPNVFVLHETWVDQAALDMHYGTEHFRRLGVNGIRLLATGRVAILATPLVEPA